MQSTPLSILFVIDPFHSLNVKKDSSVAMMKAALKNGWHVFIAEMSHVFLKDNTPFGHVQSLTLLADESLAASAHTLRALHEIEVIFMRKDPPVDEAYLYTLTILERAKALGSRVVNDPLTLRVFNEKLVTLQFQEHSPKSLLTSRKEEVLKFLEEHPLAVIKPLNSMGGDGIFLLRADDKNTPVIIETVSQHGRAFVLVQEYVAAISSGGDKRIVLIDGEPVKYGIRRIPAAHDHRGNMARGASVEGFELSATDLAICAAIKPFLLEHQVFFAGIDVIGDKLTEINITSPTGIVEISKFFSIDVPHQLIQQLELLVREHSTPKSISV